MTMGLDGAEPPDRSLQRSRGLQARSRGRLDDVLQAAEAMVAAQGFDGLKMRELARAAGLPIASLYHYFPNSSAVLRALAEQHLAAQHAALAAALERNFSGDLTAEAVPAAVGRIVRDLAEFLARTPARAAIWDAMRAMPELRALDLADTAATAHFIAPYLAVLAPGLAAGRRQDFAMVFIEAVQANLLILMHAGADRQVTLTEAVVTLAEAVFAGLQGGEGQST